MIPAQQQTSSTAVIPMISGSVRLRGGAGGRGYGGGPASERGADLPVGLAPMKGAVARVSGVDQSGGGGAAATAGWDAVGVSSGLEPDAWSATVGGGSTGASGIGGYVAGPSDGYSPRPTDRAPAGPCDGCAAGSADGPWPKLPVAPGGGGCWLAGAQACPLISGSMGVHDHDSGSAAGTPDARDTGWSPAPLPSGGVHGSPSAAGNRGGAGSLSGSGPGSSRCCLEPFSAGSGVVIACPPNRMEQFDRF